LFLKRGIRKSFLGVVVVVVVVAYALLSFPQAFFWLGIAELELELGLIQTHTAQKPALRVKEGSVFGGYSGGVGGLENRAI